MMKASSLVFAVAGAIAFSPPALADDSNFYSCGDKDAPAAERLLALRIAPGVFQRYGWRATGDAKPVWWDNSCTAKGVRCTHVGDNFLMTANEGGVSSSHQFNRSNGELVMTFSGDSTTLYCAPSTEAISLKTMLDFEAARDDKN